MLVEEDVPLAPPPEFVTPANIPPVLPYEPQGAEQPDPDLIVVVDILLETIGISIGDASLIVSLIDHATALQVA